MPYVSVDMDLDEIDTDDLIEEIESRGYSVQHIGDIPNEQLQKIWEAMYLGKPYDAMVRKFVSDQTGRFL